MASLEDLRIFAAVCEVGSLSGVARAESCTQSAVSQHVKRLEREFDIALIERGRSGVSPTTAGKVLYQAAIDSLGTLATARRRLTELRDGEAGALRITTGGTTLRHFMVEALAQVRATHPGIAVEFRSATSTADCLEELHADRADLAFVTLGTPPPGLQQRPVVRSRWVLVVTDDDPLAQRPAIGARHLRQIRYVAMPSSSRSRQMLEAQLADRGIQLTPITTVDDWDTAIRLVEVGLGHALVPALWVHDLGRHPHLRCVPVTPADTVIFGWVARRWDSLNRLAVTFVAEVQRQLRELRSAEGIEILSGQT